MWVQFFIDFALLLFLIYVPGMLLTAIFRMPALLRFSLAPIIAIVAYEMFAVVFQKVGISASFVSIALPTIIAGVIMWMVSHFLKRVRSTNCATGENPIYRWHLLALYVLVGVALGLVFFVKPLDGSNVFLQAWDNAFHLNAIKCFVDSGNYSTLAVTVHMGADPNPGTYYYPAAYHMLCAMIVDLTSSSIATCVNAANFAFACVVFPIGMYCFLERSIGFNRTAVLVGSVIAPSFVSFPWSFLIYGPLFPNLASMSIMLPAFAVAMDLFDAKTGMVERIKSGILLLISIVALGVTQPNSIFAAIVILLPYVCAEVRLLLRGRVGRFVSEKKGLYYILCVLFALALWSIFYVLPPLHAPYTMNWAAFASHTQALCNVLFIGYVRPQASLILALLVLAGSVGVVKRKSCCWMLVSYAALGLMLVVGESTEGFFKTFLTGLWYTDQYRIAAMVGLAATPLACLGAAWCMEGLKEWHGRISSILALNKPHEAARNIIVAVAVLLLFVPCFSIPGVLSIETPFGALRNDVAHLYSASGSNVLDSQEIQFLEESAQAIAGDDGIVINQAFDGSVYAYGLTGMNTYYRLYGEVWSSDETDESKCIRTNLSELATNDSVRSAVESIGAKYLLVLDYGKGDTGEGSLQYYVANDWIGVNAVNDSTPGFEVVLAKDDMRLYRLVY